MDKSSSGRHFSEKEIGALVQRATELHELAKGESDRSLSFTDIEHIASELGVPSEFLRAAALEIENDRNSSSKFSLLGGPFVIRRSIVVDETMSDDEWGEIVLKLRDALGGPGQITTVGKNKEWFRSLGVAKTRVSVRSGDGETVVRLEKHYGVGALLAYLGAIVPVFVLTSIMLTDAGANPIAGVGLILAILGAIRGMVHLWTSREKARLQELSDVIAQTFATTPVSSPEGRSPEELIDIPAVESGDDSFETKNRRRRRSGS